MDTDQCQVREIDRVCRYGGEEFTIVAFDLADDAVGRLERQALLGEPAPAGPISGRAEIRLVK